MRRALLTFGLLALAAVWPGPLTQLARQGFCAHLTMHMGVVAVAAPLRDQHLGGAIMLLGGGLSYLLGGLWLTAGLLRGPVPEPGEGA